MDIKKKANEYKSQNGNREITQKDLLFYIIGRIDDLEDKLEKYDKEATKTKTQMKMVLILIPILVTFSVYAGGLI